MLQLRWLWLVSTSIPTNLWEETTTVCRLLSDGFRNCDRTETRRRSDWLWRVVVGELCSSERLGLGWIHLGEGVYAGGDIVNGGATVVQAVADGVRAADEIARDFAGR